MDRILTDTEQQDLIRDATEYTKLYILDNPFSTFDEVLNCFREYLAHRCR
jgi:hypothetical protein